MAKPRSLIEQAVLDALGPGAIAPSLDEVMRIFRCAVHRQLADERHQRDHRYRQVAREDVVPNAVLVEPNAQVVHGVEFGGLKGAWVEAKVFVMARAVGDE